MAHLILFLGTLVVDQTLFPIPIEDVFAETIISATCAHERTYVVSYYPPAKGDLLVFDHKLRRFIQIRDGRIDSIFRVLVPTGEGIAIIDGYWLTSYFLDEDGRFLRKKRLRQSLFAEEIEVVTVIPAGLGRVLVTYRPQSPVDEGIFVASVDVVKSTREDVGFIPPGKEPVHSYVVQCGATFYRMFPHTGAVDLLDQTLVTSKPLRGHREKIPLPQYQPMGKAFDLTTGFRSRIGNPLVIGDRLVLTLWQVGEDGTRTSQLLTIRGDTLSRAEKPRFLVGKAAGTELWFDLDEGMFQIQ